MSGHIEPSADALITDPARLFTMPLVARAWMTKWQGVRGELSISPADAALPWRFEYPGDDDVEAAGELLEEFVTTLGLASAVRAAMRADELMASMLSAVS